MTREELQTLLQDIENGSEQAEEQLVRLFWKRIYSIARYRGFKHEDAGEMVQETLIETLNALRNKTFRGESSLEKFIRTLFRNVCHDHFRKTKAIKRGGDVELVTFDDPSSLGTLAFSYLAKSIYNTPLESLKGKELVRIITQCIEALEKEEYREVFGLLARGYERQTISQQLGLPLERIDNVMCYGRKLLRNCIERA